LRFSVAAALTKYLFTTYVCPITAAPAAEALLADLQRPWGPDGATLTVRRLEISTGEERVSKQRAT
jgi:hypothetical protein